MSDEKDHSGKGLKHQTLFDLVRNPQRIETQSAGHPALGLQKTAPVSPQVPVVSPPAEKKSEPQKGVRGKAYIFVPMSERVTVIREKVGNTYNGDWIHEVVGKDGRKFLASTKQLKEP